MSFNNIMKYIIKNLINKFTPKDKKILGRWNIETCDIKTNYKIDLSNEDHCGPCGQYIKNKNKKKTKNNDQISS